MKKTILFGVAIMCVSSLLAQMRPPTYGSNANGTSDNEFKSFKKEHIFIGGSLGLGYAGNTFSVGGTPEIGYSIAQWLDMGLAFNLNYYSQEADANLIYNQDVRAREFNYGAGVFARIYPVNFLFIQLQPEQNWVNIKLKDYLNEQSSNNTTTAFSFIAGVGYTRRMVGQGSYFLLLGLDLANNLYSPYRENNVAIPIIRAGFDFYLHPAKGK